jgi:precorrin-2 C(20)-methyltransferase
MYIKEVLKGKNINIIYKPGITAFSKAAAILGIPLTEWEEGLAVVPASRDSKFDLDNILKKFENIVIMKPSHNPEKIVETLKRHQLENNFKMIIKAGTEEEKIVDNLEDLKEGIPYLSTIIIKNKDKVKI